MMADPFPVQIEGLKRGLSPTTHAHPRPLSDRDLAILLAIDQYRYLDRDHVTDLFFPGRRSAELCLKDLLWRGLTYQALCVRADFVWSETSRPASRARPKANTRPRSPRPRTDLPPETRPGSQPVLHEAGGGGARPARPRSLSLAR